MPVHHSTCDGALRRVVQIPLRAACHDWLKFAHFELGDHIANNDESNSNTVPIHKLPKGRKGKFEMEDVFDDCGDDVAPIVLSLEDSQTAMFLRCFEHQMTVDEQHSFQVDT